MKLTKCKLGELITQRREKNDGSDLPICGVSKDGLIPPKQVDADTSIYNVFYRDDFIFNPARMELNSIAINDKYDRAICSSLYEVFYVHRTDLLLPHYLKLIVKQKWFTRYCEFLGQGSAREYCRFNNISEIEIEFPPVEEQRRIVEYHTAIQQRIALKKQINDNLEAQTQALFDELFLQDGKPDCTLSEIANVNPTRTLSKGSIAKCYDMSCLPTRGCVPEGGELKPYNGGVRFQNGDTLIARITPCLENGKAAYINILNDKEVAFGSTEYIVFSPIETMPSSFYYFLIRSKKFRAFALQYMNGSSGRQRVSGDELAAFPLIKPSQEALSRFAMVADPVLEQFKEASLEITRLSNLQQLIIASISSR